MWRSLPLFVAAVLAELGGAYLVWLGIREGRGWPFVLAGAFVLTGYGLLHTAQPIPHFGRVMAAYGGVFIVVALAWGAGVEGYRPDRYDLLGATLCLAGAAVIAYAPR